MSWAIGPTVMMAIVLLAVHKLAILTSPAILNSAARLELTLLVRDRMIKSIPPL